MEEALSLLHYAQSRTGLLVRFLQALADRIDPTWDVRRAMR
ncbi:MAG TPA: hypothetical protein VMW11_03945 [Candidatus Dormibacteraeota bacterium]|nr:hypothetical protein [Candidatus Dormibacteraeota bacterium]